MSHDHQNRMPGELQTVQAPNKSVYYCFGEEPFYLRLGLAYPIERTGAIMADIVEIRRKADGRVLVILHPACVIPRAKILELLRELDIHEDAVTFLLPEEVAGCGEIDDVPVVIPIDQATCDAPELEEAGRKCGQAGARVIILFGESLPYEGLHPIADKYGTQAGWLPNQLYDCLMSQEPAPPRSSSGVLVHRPDAGQVKC